MDHITLRPVGDDPEIILPGWILTSTATSEEILAILFLFGIQAGVDQKAAATRLDDPMIRTGVMKLKLRGALTVKDDERGGSVSLDLDVFQTPLHS